MRTGRQTSISTRGGWNVAVRCDTRRPRIRLYKPLSHETAIQAVTVRRLLGSLLKGSKPTEVREPAFLLHC